MQVFACCQRSASNLLEQLPHKRLELGVLATPLQFGRPVDAIENRIDGVRESLALEGVLNPG